MCKTFNDVSLSLTCPSRFNLTQAKKFAVKSIKGVFHSFDSLRVGATAIFKIFAIAHVDNLTTLL